MDKRILSIIIRYFLSIASFSLIFILPFILIPFTLYFSDLFLHLFFETILIENIIVLNGLILEISEACVALFAYPVLIALNLLTPNIKLSKRIFSILFSWGLFFLINILRILVLTFILIKNPISFDIFHSISWYILSSVLLVIIWIITIFVFKIKKIPLYSDVKYLLKNINKSNNS
jgi:exosortase/archaeosortase family protein